MSSETAFKAIPKSDDSIAVNESTQSPYIRTITLFPSGPEWILRQTEVEILSIPAWGWSDGRATVPRQDIVDILHRMSTLKQLGFVGALITALLLFVWVWHGTPMGLHSFIFIMFIVMILARFVHHIATMRLSNQLKVKFSEGVLNNMNRNTNTSDGGHKIQVTIEGLLWLRRQTNEEILSIEGWTTQDLDYLIPLLEKKKVLQRRVMFGTWLGLFGVWALCIPIYIYPDSELAQPILFVLFFIVIVIQCVSCSLLSSFATVNEDFSQMFVKRFMNSQQGNTTESC